MSIQKQWERTLNGRFGYGHASWPAFGNPIQIGDVGTLESGLFRRTQSAASCGVDLGAVDRRKTEGASLELSWGVQKSGGLAASGTVDGVTAAIELSFQDAASFWFFAPEFHVEEVDAPGDLAIAVGHALPAGMRGHDRLVYRLVRVTAGTFLWSKSSGATARVRLNVPEARGGVHIESSSTGMVQSELPPGSDAVLAFDILDATGRRVRVGV